MTENTLQEAVVSAFNLLGSDQEGAIAQLQPLFAEHVVFQDPLQRIVGKRAFFEAMRKHHGKMRHLKTRVLASAVGDGSLFVTWRFDFELRVGPSLTFEGVSHFLLEEGRIVAQRDYFDLLGSLPWLGPVYRRIAALFA